MTPAPIPAFPRGRTFTLGGSDKNWLLIEGARYDYDRDKTTCPLCGNSGIPWHGWYNCEGPCECVAWIETGEVLLPVRWRSRNHEEAKHDDA